MKEATKTGVTLLQRLKEQHNILRLKSLLPEESEDPEDLLQSMSEMENQELEETENDEEILPTEQEEKHDEENGMKRRSIPIFVPMFDQLESRTKPIEETRKKQRKKMLLKLSLLNPFRIHTSFGEWILIPPFLHVLPIRRDLLFSLVRLL